MKLIRYAPLLAAGSLYAADLAISNAGDTITLTWDGPAVLERTEDLDAGFEIMVGPMSPYDETMTTAQVFYRYYVPPFPIVDTNQLTTWGSLNQISAPAEGHSYSGQDAQYDGYAPRYTLSGDGKTVYDEVTRLTWTQSHNWNGDGTIDVNDKFSFTGAQAYADALNAANYGGFSDWRLPSIKELYSLIDFSGRDVSGYSGTDTSGLTPFIDTDYFAFGYGDTSAGERLIDAQFWSSNEYVSTTMNGDETVFGVNLADGRIKGYGKTDPMGGTDKTAYVYFVRGNEDYGANDFVNNGDGTVTDLATGLMWQQADSMAGMNWEEALAYAENLYLAGYDDWRLPNAKELQAIVDYSRSPATHGTAAIDPVFSSTAIVAESGATDYPFYWTGTTHVNSNNFGDWAVYICFGTAYGYMEMPPLSGNYQLLDVHGAGSQRSDPKAGNMADYVDASGGHGPQGDVVRIDNYVRCVRGAAVADY